MKPFAFDLEGKHSSVTGNHIDDELRVLPVFVLRCPNVERRLTDFPQQYVLDAHHELSPRITHGGASVTAAARLVEHQRTVFRFQRFDQIQCSLSGHDSLNLLCHACLTIKMAPGPIVGTRAPQV
jgi:hypothetical protein